MTAVEAMEAAGVALVVVVAEIGPMVVVVAEIGPTVVVGAEEVEENMRDEVVGIGVATDEVGNKK